MSTPVRLRRIAAEAVRPLGQETIDAETLGEARALLDEVNSHGEAGLRSAAERFGDVQPDQPLVYDRDALARLAREVGDDVRGVLERTAERIREFAAAQRACLTDLETPVPGGLAGHTVTPLSSAGCYAPGGRFPLPSSVLMTAVTARVAGVEQVVVASPKPTPVTLAAAHVAGADMLLAAGGAHAIGALAYGAGLIPVCDVVVGPGNRWVTAAKQLIAGQTAIDMLAGPSELVVVADASADPAVVAADLLAQAEHDPDALPVLVALDAKLADAVDAELGRQLATLPTAETAGAALQQGFAVLAADSAEAQRVCDALAPEHLALHVADASEWRTRLRNYGALFEGAASAEVFGDYGIGPNHVLPTGGTARTQGGLSVFTFLRVRTWLRLETDRVPAEIIDDTAALARLEGLEAHARSALQRKGD